MDEGWYARRRQAEGRIRRAVWAGAFSGLVTLLAGLLASLDADLYAHALVMLAHAVVVLACSYGVHQKNPGAAMLLLLDLLYRGAETWSAVHGMLPLLGIVLFGFFYVQGLRGTVAWHELVRLHERSRGAVLQGGAIRHWSM